MPDIELKEYTLEDLKRREKKILGKPQTDRRIEKLKLVRAQIEKRGKRSDPVGKAPTSSKRSGKLFSDKLIKSRGEEQLEKKIEKVPPTISPAEAAKLPCGSVKKDEVKTTATQTAKLKPGGEEVKWPKKLVKTAKKKAVKKNADNGKSKTDKAGETPVPTGWSPSSRERQVDKGS